MFFLTPRPGIEPGSFARQAKILTTILPRTCGFSIFLDDPRGTRTPDHVTWKHARYHCAMES